MAILQRADQADAADRLIAPLAESWFAWDESPASYERIRSQLAELISEGKAGTAKRSRDDGAR